jgi:hypothetical protein
MTGHGHEEGQQNKGHNKAATGNTLRPAIWPLILRNRFLLRAVGGGVLLLLELLLLKDVFSDDPGYSHGDYDHKEKRTQNDRRQSQGPDPKMRQSENCAFWKYKSAQPGCKKAREPKNRLTRSIASDA